VRYKSLIGEIIEPRASIAQVMCLQTTTLKYESTNHLKLETTFAAKGSVLCTVQVVPNALAVTRDPMMKFLVFVHLLDLELGVCRDTAASKASSFR